MLVWLYSWDCEVEVLEGGVEEAEYGGGVGGSGGGGLEVVSEVELLLKADRYSVRTLKEKKMYEISEPKYEDKLVGENKHQACTRIEQKSCVLLHESPEAVGPAHLPQN